MSTARKVDPTGDGLRRRFSHWHIYAAVTGSAMAVTTNMSIGAREIAAEPLPAHSVAEQVSPNAMAASAVHTNQSKAPVIAAGGIVPLYGSVGIIQPGEWVSIYGSNLATGPAVWNGNFPTSLGGTSVLINGKLAYLSMVSPGQINLQAPDDSAVVRFPYRW